MVTPQETYKIEFAKNANLTFYKGFFDSCGVYFDKVDLLDFSERGFSPLDSYPTIVDNVFLKDTNYITPNLGIVEESVVVDGSDVLFCNIASTEDDFIDFGNTSKIDGLFGGLKFLQGIDKAAYGQVVDTPFTESHNVSSLGKFLNFSEFGDESRIVKRSFGKSTPLRVIKNPVVDVFNSKTFKNFSEEADLLRFRFNDFEAKLQQKPVPHTTYLTLKQKRYNVRTKIKPTTRVEERPTVYSFSDVTGSDTVLQKTKTIKSLNNSATYSKNPFLKNLSIIEDNVFDPTRQYRMVKKARNRSDQTSINT